MVHRLGTVAGADIEQCAYCRICHSISVYLLDTEVWVGHSPQCVDVVGILFRAGCRRLFRHTGDERCRYGVAGFLAPHFPAAVRASWHAGYTGSGHPYNGDSSFPEISGCECADTSRLTLEFFSFAHIGTLLLRIAASTLLTVTCIMAVEGIRKKG